MPSRTKRDQPSEARLLDFLNAARKAVRLKGEVSLLLTSNREMRRLNRVFRRKDKPTDVLSFPAAEAVSMNLAGDLAISIDIAGTNARQLGHSVEDEVRVLILHGLLHLAGYDHEADDGQMARKELRLRKQLGLPVSLIERISSASGMTKKRTTTKRMTKKRKPRSSSPPGRGR
jgi:probable rRNA maturation factor